MKKAVIFLSTLLMSGIAFGQVSILDLETNEISISLNKAIKYSIKQFKPEEDGTSPISAVGPDLKDDGKKFHCFISKKIGFLKDGLRVLNRSEQEIEQLFADRELHFKFHFKKFPWSDGKLYDFAYTEQKENELDVLCFSYGPTPLTINNIAKMLQQL